MLYGNYLNTLKIKEETYKMIRQYIRNILKENAIQNMASEGFGILSVQGPHENYSHPLWVVVLYDTNQAMEIFEEDVLYDRAPEDGEPIEAGDLIDAIQESIYSVMRLRPADSDLTRDYPNQNRTSTGNCYGAWEAIRLASLEKGYGWRINQLVMSKAEKGTFPDRNSISDPAEAMYIKGANNGAYSVTPLDDIDNPKTKDTEDDCVVWGPNYFGDETKIDYVHNMPFDASWNVMMANTNNLIAKIANHSDRKEFENLTSYPTQEELMGICHNMFEVNELVAQAFTDVYEMEDE